VLRVILHCSAHMTWISYGITAIATVVPLLLVARKFLADEIAWATSMAACFVAALGGAVFRSGEWYEHLAKPSWRPPNRLFVPVWTVCISSSPFPAGWFGARWASPLPCCRCASQAMHRPIMGGSVSRGELTHAPCWWRRPNCAPWPQVGRRAVRHWRVRYSNKKAEPGRSTIHARCDLRSWRPLPDSESPSDSNPGCG